MSTLKAGLIQIALKGDTSGSPGTIRETMIAAHAPLIEQAGARGVQMLCLQEIFTQPYFCRSQDTKWYDATERIPDGPTTKLMQEYARKNPDGDRRAAVRRVDEPGSTTTPPP